MFILILQRLFLEAFLDIFYFPFWWYTHGVRHAALWCFDLLKQGNRTLAAGLWLQNLFVPMFGQHDLQGRIISVFMRFINVIGRGFALLVWLQVCLVLFLLWLALPIVVIYGLVSSLFIRKT